MTTKTAELSNRIFDAMDKCFDENVHAYDTPVCGVQEFYDSFMKKLDEILNDK